MLELGLQRSLGPSVCRVCTHDLGQHCLDLRSEGIQQREVEAGQEGEQSLQRDRNPHGEKGNELSWPP